MASLLLGLLCVFVFLHELSVSDCADDTATRLSRLEAQLSDTQSRLTQVEGELTSTKTQLSDTKTQLSDTMTQLSSRLDHTETQLSDTKTQLSDTQWRLTQAEEELASTKTQLSQRSVTNIKTVAFHARFLRTEPKAYSPLIVRDVITNIGNGYNSSTGIFTAPKSGVYFFVGATGPDGGGHWAGMWLVVDGGDIAFSTAYDQHDDEQTSVHGVVHLTAGQTVWMKAAYTADYSSIATTFSGFLITSVP